MCVCLSVFVCTFVYFDTSYRHTLICITVILLLYAHCKRPCGPYVANKCMYVQCMYFYTVLGMVFSERELTFTFAICCRPSVCRLSVCLSVVGNARAPYSGGCNFRQYFYGIRYLGHPMTSTENFTEIVPGEPLRWGS